MGGNWWFLLDMLAIVMPGEGRRKGQLHFWAKASWSDNTPSNSSARSNTSFKIYWENSSAHLAFPRTMRKTSVGS